MRKMARKMVTETVRRENEALIDEMSRFNAALACGAHVMFHAKAGDRQVTAWRQEGGTCAAPPRGRLLNTRAILIASGHTYYVRLVSLVIHTSLDISITPRSRAPGPQCCQRHAYGKPIQQSPSRLWTVKKFLDSVRTG